MFGRSWTTGAFAACTFAFLVSSGSTSQASAACTDYSDITCVAQHAVEAANRFEQEYVFPASHEELFRKLGALLVHAGVAADRVTPPTPWARDGLDDGIALGMIERGELDAVLRLLNSSGRDKSREKAIEQLLEQGRYDDAWYIYGDGDLFGPRQKMLAMIARARAQSGDVDQAISDLLIEVEFIQGMATTAPEHLAEPLCWTLTALADLAPDHNSKQAINESLALSAALGIEEQDRREDALRHTAWCFTASGRFDQAMAAVSWIEDPRKRSDQISIIVSEMIKAGDTSGARRAFLQITPDKSAQYFANSLMTAALVNIGHLDEAEATLRKLEGSRAPTLAYADLAEAYLERGQDEKALEYVRKIQEAVASSNTPWSELKILHRFSHLAEVTTIDGYLDAGLKRLRANSNPSRYDVASAAEALALYGRHDEAVNLILTLIPENDRLPALVNVGFAMAGLER